MITCICTLCKEYAGLSWYLHSAISRTNCVVNSDVYIRYLMFIYVGKADYAVCFLLRNLKSSLNRKTDAHFDDVC